MILDDLLVVNDTGAMAKPEEHIGMEGTSAIRRRARPVILFELQSLGVPFGEEGRAELLSWAVPCTSDLGLSAPRTFPRPSANSVKPASLDAVDGLEAAIFTRWLAPISAVAGGFFHWVLYHVCICALVEFDVGIWIGSVVMGEKT